MDGLMFDTEVLAEKIWTKILASHSLVFNKEFLDSIKGRNIADSKVLFEKYYDTNISFLDLKEERNEMLEYELRHNGVPIKKGLVEALNYLKSLNKKIALASSSSKQLILDNLKDTNLTAYFDYIVSGEDFKQSKPNPEIFLNCSKHFNLQPERCLVLEDSKSGIEAAINANMQAVWVPDLVRFDIPSKVIKIKDLTKVLTL